jgi:hypothetical protein
LSDCPQNVCLIKTDLRVPRSASPVRTAMPAHDHLFHVCKVLAREALSFMHLIWQN